jgi:hypothetical protein
MDRKQTDHIARQLHAMSDGKLMEVLERVFCPPRHRQGVSGGTHPDGSERGEEFST